MRRHDRIGWLSLVFVLTNGCSSDNGSTGDQAATGGETGGASAGGGAGTGGAKVADSGAGGGSGGTAGKGGGAGSGGGAASGGGAGSGGSTASGGGAGSGGSPPVTCATDAGTPAPAGTPPALTPGEWKQITPPGICAGAHYGCMDIRVHPCNPYVVYLTSDMEGMWKSADGGSTWTHIGNLGAPIWCNATQLDSPGDMQIDPKDGRRMYYVGGVRGCTVGFWVSSDGGDTWTMPKGFSDQANNSVGGWTNDAYDVKADPADFNHVLVAFHAGFEWTGDAGILESKDGGNTWIRHWPRGWGAGHSVWFLKDSSTWLVGTQYAGYWRTTDAGGNWSQVSTRNMQHGGTDIFYSKTGVLYVGALSNVLRSTDNGVTFTTVAPNTGDGYYAIVGDGNLLYTQLANTGGHGGAAAPYVTSPETDGTTWTPYNSQTFSDGPYRMTFDPVNRIIYSANWNAGVWALKVK